MIFEDLVNELKALEKCYFFQFNVKNNLSFEIVGCLTLYLESNLILK